MRLNGLIVDFFFLAGGRGFFQFFFEASVDRTIYRDYLVNRRSFIYCSLAGRTIGPVLAWGPLKLTVCQSKLTSSCVPCRTVNGEEWVVDRFQKSPPMSTYLLTFTVCQFQSQRANTSRGYTVRRLRFVFLAVLILLRLLSAFMHLPPC